jgi:Cytidylyltransferase-like
MVEPAIAQVVAQIHATPITLVLEFTGAGSLALFWLHSVPGSSRTILEATDRYAATALTDLLGHAPATSVAQETAAAMAIQAYRRAMRLSDGATPCLGIACTATITTDRAKRGDHHCWIAVRDSAGVTSYGLVLTKGLRDRLAEETVVSQLLLHGISEACGTAAQVDVDVRDDEAITTAREALPDPLAQLLDGAAQSVTVAPDGIPTMDQPVTGAILSGSFNPLHAGHERLAEAASATLGRPVTFELPIVNADKPPLSYAEIERRLAQFRWRYTAVLSRAALFRDKATLFPGCVFIVGYDTAVRLVEPRYYGSTTERDAALAAIRAAGCRFLVAGRLLDGSYRTLADIAVPAAARDLFSALPESAFRVDLSSSAIRERMG